MRIREKVARIAQEFAEGKINRAQFQELFAHYQREQRTIETWLSVDPDSDAWKDALAEGKSLIIRNKYKAQVKGLAIYLNRTGMPLAHIGSFNLDPDLVIPMLSSLRSATEEMFGSAIRASHIEGGGWLGFIGGRHTTLLALYSAEPAKQQLMRLEELHRVFEKANQRHFEGSTIDPRELVYTQQVVLRSTHQG